MNQTTPPGWYPDGQGGQRWWDGNQWTEHTLPPEAPDQPAQPAQQNPGATQVRPDGPGQEQPGDRPAEPGQPPAAMPTQVAGGGFGQQQQPGYPGQQQPGYPQQGGYPGQPQQGGYPGQPGQPAWQGQQYGGGSGGGINGKLIGIIGGGAVAVIVVIVLLFVVLGGSGGPKGVVEDFLDADSCSDVEDLVSENLKESFGDCSDEDIQQFQGGEGADVDTEVKDEKIDGDKATVEVEASGSFGGEDFSSTTTFHLVKEDGDWKIDSIG